MAPPQTSPSSSSRTRCPSSCAPAWPPSSARPWAASYEVIVVENASGDGSAALVRDEFPDVRLIALEQNIGFAAGSNLGARAADGRVRAACSTRTPSSSATRSRALLALRARASAGRAGRRAHAEPGRRARPRLVLGRAEPLEPRLLRVRASRPCSAARASSIPSRWAAGGATARVRSTSSRAVCASRRARSGTSSAASTRRSSCTARTPTWRRARASSATARRSRPTP